MEKVTSSDKSVQYYTRITSLSVFIGLFNIIVGNLPNFKYWSGKDSDNEKRYQHQCQKPGPKLKLSQLHEFTLTIIRLRHGLPIHILADLFGVSSSRVSQIFNTWIIVMSSIFKGFITCMAVHRSVSETHAKIISTIS